MIEDVGVLTYTVFVSLAARDVLAEMISTLRGGRRIPS
jgi:hypothetical protein